MKSNPIGETYARPLVPLGLVFIFLFMLTSAVFGTAIYCFIALMAWLFGGHPTWNGALWFAVLFAFGFPVLLPAALADSEDR